MADFTHILQGYFTGNGAMGHYGCQIFPESVK